MRTVLSQNLRVRLWQGHLQDYISASDMRDLTDSAHGKCLQATTAGTCQETRACVLL